MHTSETTSAKHTFRTVRGAVLETERFMQGPHLTDGHVWCKTNDFDNVWVETPAQPKIDDDDKLFGYDKDAFLRRQFNKQALSMIPNIKKPIPRHGAITQKTS